MPVIVVLRRPVFTVFSFYARGTCSGGLAGFGTASKSAMDGAGELQQLLPSFIYFNQNSSGAFSPASI
jgi:hypothetical protein